MSKLQHSPGPWKAEKGHSGRLEYVVDAECWEICVPRIQADIRLIAAAPNMLRLLRVMCGKNTWEELIAAMDEGKGLIARLDGGE